MTEVKRPAPRPIHKSEHESDPVEAPAKAKSDKGFEFDNAPGYSDEQLAQIKGYYGK